MQRYQRLSRLRGFDSTPELNDVYKCTYNSACGQGMAWLLGAAKSGANALRTPFSPEPWRLRVFA